MSAENKLNTFIIYNDNKQYDINNKYIHFKSKINNILKYNNTEYDEYIILWKNVISINIDKINDNNNDISSFYQITLNTNSKDIYSIIAGYEEKNKIVNTYKNSI